MNRRLISLILLALFAAACRGGEPPADSRPTPMNAPISAEGGGGAEEGGGVGQPLTLRLWAAQSDAHDAANRALIDAYAAGNPGVVIALETFPAADYEAAVAAGLASGVAADLMLLPGGAVCGQSAALAPVPDSVTTLAAAQTAFRPEALGPFVCDGVLYGLPLDATTPWGLVVALTSGSPNVAWDVARFAADPANAAQWNTTTGTQPAGAP